VLLGGLALQALGVGLIAFTSSYEGLVIGSAINGLGNSVYHPSDFSILNARVAGSRLGYAYSAHGMAGSLGYASAPIFAGIVSALFGWQVALYAASGIGLLIFLLLAFNASRLEGARQTLVHAEQSITSKSCLQGRSCCALFISRSTRRGWWGCRASPSRR